RPPRWGSGTREPTQGSSPGPCLSLFGTALEVRVRGLAVAGSVTFSNAFWTGRRARLRRPVYFRSNGTAGMARHPPLLGGGKRAGSAVYEATKLRAQLERGAADGCADAPLTRSFRSQ